MNKDTKSFMTIMDFALENVTQDGNMKLICELQESVDYELIEEGDGKPKQYYIEGIFMQSEKKNKNGRIYPLPILEKEVSRYVKEYVEPKRAFGELGHPDGPTVNLDRASHMISSLKKESPRKQIEDQRLYSAYYFRF